MALPPGARAPDFHFGTSPESRDPFSNHYYDNESDAEYDRNGDRRQTSYDQGSVGSYTHKRADTDTESELDVYGARAYSYESLNAARMSGIDSPMFGEFAGSTGHESYPAWSPERNPPLSREEVEDVFLDLAQKFGFQRDSMRNMFDFTMQMLDSRASRMSPDQALITLHADYIGGRHANYRKWYFAAQLDLDDHVGQVQNPGLRRLNSMKRPGAQQPKKQTSSEKSLEGALERWRQAMASMSQYDRLRQIALYLLCWGEAAQVRFVPECLCFIFKCADDYYRSPECQSRQEPVPEGLYLRAVIKPLYRFIRDQGYEVVDGKFVRREKDHQDIIGYDDINQLFWYPEGIGRIVLANGQRLTDLPPPARFMKFDKIDWNRAFYKTYYEKRSAFHLLVNFNRIWVIHIAVFWFYTAYNSPNVYRGRSDAPTTAMSFSISALGGAVASLIMILATLAEFSYIPTSWNNSSHLARRLIFLFVCLGITAGPTFYVALSDPKSKSNVPLIVSIVQFAISIAITALFGIWPSGRMFGDRVAGKARKYLASQTFTASYPTLSTSARIGSVCLWLLVFGCKLTESYYFLTLPFADSIAVMAYMEVRNCNDRSLGSALCTHQPAFTLTIMYILDLVLFFLDTFLWWIIWNTVFSIARSFLLGLSIWAPWSDIYRILPKSIYAKILATSDMEIKYKPKVLVSQVWNALIISMYREHLLGINHVQQMLYHQVTLPDGRAALRAPSFFANSEKKVNGRKVEFFPKGSEAERRISFFAQSLTTSFPEPMSVEAMPTFTVLTPHYNEKVLLSLREIIREQDQNTRVTLLEYLKQLHPIEWDNFVKDSKILAEEGAPLFGGGNGTESSKTDDLPFYCVGFKSAAPEYTLRTRIWASLRAQTLYRTVSGMMNYAKAIKLLYRVENPEIVQLYGNTEKLERELERMARRKFKFVVSMQRYSKFNREEQEDAEFLLRAYPDLQIAYLDEEPSNKEGGETRLYSALIDGYSEYDAVTGRRRPTYRVELPGNPILGDGKSDNQNHAIIFYRGEYLQLIDANQDNYLEECLKIRNILGEFEPVQAGENPYGRWNLNKPPPSPVAIVGAREYIFSENIGVLGDVAAGKEQTFGTLAARSLAWIGGKLHYGHPDFLNAIFMTTRGGVSKAQKGLHLNEDIYAGMNAFGRGGRIKHTEYYQCGKGRDLGFGTILNFQTKIGTGMGEQMLSREYYYLGTQLPIDRFLTFYYGHPGFHINNILVILSVQLFLIVLTFLGTLNSNLTLCKYTKDGDLLPNQDGCYPLIPVFDWIKRCMLSIFLVFAIAFLPLFLQELVERGTGRALVRLGRQFLSLSPFFEMFSTQIYTHSILSNLTFGGARYIATGRGFATSRTSFYVLYSRFAGASIYLGMRSVILLFYITMTFWIPHLIFFWIVVVALCISPFLFNPHQFSFMDFMIDYRVFLHWLSRGNSRSHRESWIGYCRLSRTMITGFKKKRLGHPSEKLSADVPRANWRNVLFSEIILPIVMAIVFVIAYTFVKSFPDERGRFGPTALVRILVMAIAPIGVNAAILLILFLFSILLGPMLTSCAKFGASMATIAHGVAVVALIGTFEFLWFLERWDPRTTVLGWIAIIFIHRAFFKVMISVFLSREFKHDETNRAWWTGKWYGRGLGSDVMSQIAREYLVKIIELSLWTCDFILGHLLLFVLALPVLVPYADRLHSTMLFWLRPSRQIRAPLYSMKQKKTRHWIAAKYGTIFILMLAMFAVLIILPLVFRATDSFTCAICRDF